VSIVIIDDYTEPTASLLRSSVCW